MNKVKATVSIMATAVILSIVFLAMGFSIKADLQHSNTYKVVNHDKRR